MSRGVSEPAPQRAHVTAPHRTPVDGRPCIDVLLPKKPDLRKTFDDVLSAREVDRLIDGISDRSPGCASLKTNDRYEALAFMGTWLGPRWNEPIGLRRCDLNPLGRSAGTSPATSCDPPPAGPVWTGPSPG